MTALLLPKNRAPRAEVLSDSCPQHQQAGIQKVHSCVGGTAPNGLTALHPLPGVHPLR